MFVECENYVPNFIKRRLVKFAPRRKRTFRSERELHVRRLSVSAFLVPLDF